MLKKSEITEKGLKELEKRFHFTHIENSEIFAAWATLAIPRNYQNIDFDDKVSEFLKNYAETGNQYVEVLQKIIKQNNLKDFDDAKLLPSR